MTPEKSFSTPKSRKRKGYHSRKEGNRAAIKKRRSDDYEFCKAENEARLERFNKDCENSDFLAKHSENHWRDIKKKFKNSEKRTPHNTCQSDRLKNPEVREKHNKYVLEKYITNREEVSSIILNYSFQISQRPTYVCSCCGCLLFRKAVVILIQENLVSTNVSKSDCLKQVIIRFNIDIFIVNSIQTISP